MSHGSFSSQEDDDDETESEAGGGSGVRWRTTLAAPGDEQETYTTQTRIRLRGGVEVKRSSRDSLEGDDESTIEGESETRRKLRKYMSIVRVTLLFICWLIFTLLLMLHEASKQEPHMLCVPPNETVESVIVDEPRLDRLEVDLHGPFMLHISDSLKKFRKPEDGEMTVVALVATIDDQGNRLSAKTVSAPWIVELHDTLLFDTAPVLKRAGIFEFTEAYEPAADKQLLLTFATNIDEPVPLILHLQASPIPEPWNYISALLLLSGMYVLIIFNVIHRTMASLLTCTFALAILATYNQLPPLTTVMEWIDIGLLMEIFGMSVIVTAMAKTGIIESLAAKGYEWANGHIWPMLNLMIVIVSLATLIFDNIAIIILMSPIMIRLSEVMMLNPVPVLMCLIIMTNIASAWSPIGDPPNAVIRNNYYVTEEGIGFATFVAHALPATLLAMITAYIHLRIQYYSSNKMRFTERSELERLQRVIKVWRKTAAGMAGYSKDEKTARDTVDIKVRRLRKRVRRIGKMPKPPADFDDTLEMLKAHYAIRNKVLLYQCLIALLFIVVMYFFILLYAFGIQIHIPPGWIALLGAILLLIITDCEMEAVLLNIEWATLLFLATLFVLIAAMDEMELNATIGRFTEYLVFSTKPEWRLTVALVVVLWLSAFASALLVNLPVTSLMLGIVISLSKDTDLNLPLSPLIWALSLGVCLGGNGSLVGAVSNIVCVGIAEKHGYKFQFMDFFKIGFPVMLGSLIISTVYLLVVHVALKFE